MTEGVPTQILGGFQQEVTKTFLPQFLCPGLEITTNGIPVSNVLLTQTMEIS